MVQIKAGYFRIVIILSAYRPQLGGHGGGIAHHLGADPAWICRLDPVMKTLSRCTDALYTHIALVW